jgi:hypothetical protein
MQRPLAVNRLPQNSNHAVSCFSVYSQSKRVIANRAGWLVRMQKGLAQDVRGVARGEILLAHGERLSARGERVVARCKSGFAQRMRGLAQR